MARITSVTAARKRKPGQPPFVCYTCRKPIVEGQAYNWVQPSRFSSRYNWHADHAPPPPSVLESNEKRARAMEAFESAYDELDAIDTDAVTDADDLMTLIREVLDSCAEGVREAAEMWRESATNIEDGFGHATTISDEMNEHADLYDGVADEVEQVADGLDEYRADEWDSIVEWARSAVEAAGEDLGSAEGEID